MSGAQAHACSPLALAPLSLQTGGSCRVRCGLACFGCSRAAYSPSCFNSAQVRLSGSVANTPHTQNDRSIFTATRSRDSDAASPDSHHTSTPPTGTNEAHLPSLRPDHEAHFHFTLPSTATPAIWLPLHSPRQRPTVPTRPQHVMVAQNGPYPSHAWLEDILSHPPPSRHPARANTLRPARS